MSASSKFSGMGQLDYQITRNGETDELEFTPPKGCRELRDSLHFHFPEEPDYKSRIQRAIGEFCGYSAGHLTMLDYYITRNTDGELEFEPKKGTKELRDALHYRFPDEEDYKPRIQRAILAFREMEGPSLENLSLKRVHTASSARSVAHTLTPQGSALTSRGLSKQSSNRSGSGSGRSRRRFNPAERREIYDNRGNVCAKHKKNNEKCNPDTCEGNLQYSARRAARAEAEHAAQFPNSTSNFQLPFHTDMATFGPNIPHSPSASESDLHLAYQQLSQFSSQPVDLGPPHASVSSLPIMQPSLPMWNSLPADFYAGTPGLPIPPTVPSNDYAESGIQQNNTATHEMVNNGALTFDQLASPDAYASPTDTHSQSRNLLPEPRKLISRPSKGGPLAILRRTFEQLFRTKSVLP
ncbi:hypothetical protein P154DRAFT_539005 [Amniculicola lignicola CBS 123094]|uniref:Uncharacterized protein n=1 Tax=Amniculicola lignicola CBS 123094 TaxID=1392246 RepID=A0A6A5W264_9PLEO|nr:hypothetical protein P154DRAFT_539005 [Amniculicola lignicola CBS 123094]